MEESKRSKFRRICVFCGSNSGRRKVFRDAALELGNELICGTVCLQITTEVLIRRGGTDNWSGDLARFSTGDKDSDGF